LAPEKLSTDPSTIAPGSVGTPGSPAIVADYAERCDRREFAQLTKRSKGAPIIFE